MTPEVPTPRGVQHFLQPNIQESEANVRFCTQLKIRDS